MTFQIQAQVSQYYPYQSQIGLLLYHDESIDYAAHRVSQPWRSHFLSSSQGGTVISPRWVVVPWPALVFASVKEDIQINII